MEIENAFAVLGILGTLIGSLGGVALAQRHERAMAKLERAERRRAELRGHVVAFLVNANEWIAHSELVIFMVWKSSPDDLVALTRSEPMTQAAELRRSVTDEVTHLIGLVGDDRLQAAVYGFHDLWVKVPEDVMGSVSDNGREHDQDAPGESLRAIRKLQRAALEIRNASLPLLTVAVNEPEPIRWWQVRARYVRRRASRGQITRGEDG